MNPKLDAKCPLLAPGGTESDWNRKSPVTTSTQALYSAETLARRGLWLDTISFRSPTRVWKTGAGSLWLELGNCTK